MSHVPLAVCCVRSVTCRLPPTSTATATDPPPAVHRRQARKDPKPPKQFSEEKTTKPGQKADIQQSSEKFTQTCLWCLGHFWGNVFLLL